MSAGPTGRTRPRAGGLDLTSLRGAFGVYARARSTRVIAADAAVVPGLRLALGRWSWLDLVVAAALVLAQPFIEWVIHVYVLHARPRTVRGHTFDSLLARDHRRHHLDPTDIDLVWVPWRVAWHTAVGGMVLGALLARAGATLALTALAVASLRFLVYEWIHFLVHTPYRPRSRWYRRLHRLHRLHHYRNEHYWFGVTAHLGDRVLGTLPERGDVPLSDTARTLGIDPAA